ncbi:MAG: RdgB/HAM1 family non-canonical purine NTP pyrophosphatase [Candidatus Caldarchaeum sp.]
MKKKHPSIEHPNPSLVIATANPKKGAEMLRILQKLLPEWHLLTLKDFTPLPEPRETGDTYDANAKIKAHYYCERLNLMCLADDAGLEIDALGGKPGVQSKRFGGESKAFSDKISMILDLLKNTLESERTARFQCSVALAIPQNESKNVPICKLYLFRASCEGKIASSPRGTRGFGYDPIFLPSGSDKTFAEMSPEEKDAVSHRGKVLRQVAEWLSRLTLS